jgi:hypothetical protein
VWCRLDGDAGIDGIPVLAVLVPLGTNENLASGVHYHTTYPGSSPELIAQVKSVLAQGKTVDVDVAVDLRADEPAWDAFEDFLTQVTKDAPSGKLVLCAYPCPSTPLPLHPSTLSGPPIAHRAPHPARPHCC